MSGGYRPGMAPATPRPVGGGDRPTGRPASRQRVAGQRRRPRPDEALASGPRTVPTRQLPDATAAAPGASGSRLAPTGRVPDAAAGTEAREAPGGGRRWPLLVASGVLVLALAACAVLGLVVRDQRAAERARGQALEAASQAAAVVLSYDHRSLEEDFEAGLALTTGEFREEYAATTETSVRPLAEETDAVVEADVRSAAVVEAGADRAVVLLFVNQTTTSTRADRPQVDLNRVRMTMERVDGRWLVAGVDGL